MEIIERWKQKLLDLSKRNRLINYKETKRSNINIIKPNIDTIFDKIVRKGKTMEFAQIDKHLNLYNFDNEGEEPEKVRLEDIEIMDDELLTNRTDNEMLKTLARIRLNSKTAMEEQGVNILYLSFGMLEWTEVNYSNNVLRSPILLVPVILTIESMFEPYKISMTDDEIVVNPTLLFKLNRDFNITLPEFGDEDDSTLKDYLRNIEEVVSDNNWTVSNDITLGLFSFLKLNMYKDLEKNIDKVSNHAVIKALAGDHSDLKPAPEELMGEYDHDNKIRPIDTFQVVDADASQQDAIVAANKDVSFVLQGPPGTGKSQTITNIIAECLAEGKKVLFVSQKMAALEVVYKRLNDVGLTDYCLQLHSHKANKKDVISELGRTLNIARNQTRDEALAELEQLLEDRNKLNEYQKSLHTLCKPLEKSIYEIHGRLLSYQYAPDLAFSFDNVEDCTQSDINKYKRIIEYFSRTANKLGSDYKSNPWYGSNIDEFTLELQHDIIMNFDSLSGLLNRIAAECTELEDQLFLRPKKTLVQIEKLNKLLEITAKSPQPPLSWMTSRDLEPLMEQAKELQLLSQEYKGIKTEINNSYTEVIFRIKAEATLNSLEEGINTLMNGFKDIDHVNGIIEKRVLLKDVVEDMGILTSKTMYLCAKIIDSIGAEDVTTLREMRKLEELVANILIDPKPLDSWFDERHFTIVKKVFNEAKEKHQRKSCIENGLNEIFDNDVFSIEYKLILNRFRTKYNNFLKYVKLSYHGDRKAIRLIQKNTSIKLSDEDCLKYLQELKERDEIIEWIDEKGYILKQYLGNWYNEDYTQWDDASKALEAFEKINNYYANKGVPEKTKKLLLNSTELYKVLEEDYRRLEEQLSKTELIIDAGKLVDTEDLIEDTKVEKLHEITIKLKEILNNVLGNYDHIVNYNLAGNTSLLQVISDVRKIARLQEIELLIKEQSADLQDLFKYHFKGLETNWEAILESLIWTNKFKTFISDFEVTDNFIEQVCNEKGAISIASNGTQTIYPIFADIKKELEFINNLFEDNIHKFNEIDIKVFANWLKECKGNFGALEEWIDFKRSREECVEAELGDFINKIIENKIPNKQIVGTFFKRFYRLWLDIMHKRFPSIIGFRRRNHEVTINDFRLLDKKQLLVARARIREQLSSNMPSVGALTEGRGEIDMLRRELGKKRRIMPLRKLFKNIPNLLMALKPCLMMSPLSVSLFLDPNDYEFDTVIFDEASQVCPEDAVGAIYRAKQVIIAGDNEQLPPTNFFGASSGESDYDDEDDSDVDAFESILDEAQSFLSQKVLKWHYRSKHEHLITFSNAKIYARKHESLITFPSCVDRIADNGVEYIHVLGGIYDRSSSRTNKVEAQEVAKLVFNHFRNYPNRSLGVVTFSEAQRNEVESCVRHLRGKNSAFEQYFDESIEENFFIKNLENVQGDERDTIIFSIGYAKDQNGVMGMNLGPLSKIGGYRRLNVAITRAKYNVKLVGSIRPTDIDLERTNADGVKMLRSYIEYAINGPDSILNEITEPESIYTESPFEEEVYKFLKDKGYKVATQVGCSRYRIDMAIKHPTLSGKYIIGIECDGATYHSARIARERDRLREDVLQDRGWKLYRIWSTDWIKDPVSESKRLVNAIEEAMDNFSEDDYGVFSGVENSKVLDEEEVLDHISVEIDKGEAETENNGYGFDEYKEADIYEVERYINESDEYYLSKVIMYVLKIEGPTHFEVLCRRLAPLFGREKATSPVRNRVDDVLNTKLSGKVKKLDSFCWDKENECVKVKACADPDEKRQIEHICKEELAEAMYVIVKRCFGIAYEDLFIEAARVFGFKRTGENIQNTMMNALIYLIDSKRVNDNNGKISDIA